MNIHVERLPDCQATMRVEIPAEVVQKERKGIVAMFAAQAKIPGFRPGKVPANVVEKRYAKQITEQLQSKLVEEGYREGIKKEELEVLGVNVEEPEFHLDDTFSFVAKIQTAPEFSLPEYKNIPVEVPRIEVTDHDVDHEMEHMRSRMAQYEDIDGRPIEMGDFVVIDYGGVMDGVPLDEKETGQLAKGEDAWLRMGEDTFLPGFCEQLVGLNVGESKDFDITLDDEFPAEPMRGKVVNYHAEVKGLKKQVIPDWTDEMAGKIEEGLTLEALRERTKEQIEGYKKMQRNEEMTTQILEYLDKELDFELPQQVVFGETQRQVNEIAQNIAQRGATEDDLEEKKDEIISYASQQAEANVKTSFILEQIAKKEEIRAEENEIVGYCSQLAAQSNVSLNSYIKQVQKANGFGQIANRIVTSKTLEFLRDNASVTETEPPAHDCEHDHGHEGHDHDHSHDEESASDEKAE
tara:strand:+ start:1717 stop:3111 length:1395 start_codon:yes stop_codon:yes gene_type:complete